MNEPLVIDRPPRIQPVLPFDAVEIPPPPEQFAWAQGTTDEDGTWDFLSDLPWQAASSGWTPNKDGLPRRNRDVANNLMQLGARTYRKGLGTHAPSEIVYDLSGKSNADGLAQMNALTP